MRCAKPGQSSLQANTAVSIMPCLFVHRIWRWKRLSGFINGRSGSAHPDSTMTIRPLHVSHNVPPKGPCWRHRVCHLGAIVVAWAARGRLGVGRNINVGNPLWRRALFNFCVGTPLHEMSATLSCCTLFLKDIRTNTEPATKDWRKPLCYSNSNSRLLLRNEAPMLAVRNVWTNPLKLRRQSFKRGFR